ncbi:zinc finger, RING/FYVE/PHD-type [Artemisia annua]|uniref:RING-type E3 ubiquitin transferase n=1 Tax=Artemisia annua TaxID=35608 RepID=A0A2U1QLI8_ARTAN|nr:zinc finger, RING/FYVE/PHD-type [Artemisia annua]
MNFPAHTQKTLFCLIIFIIIFPNSTLSQNVTKPSNSTDSISKLTPVIALVVGLLLCIGLTLICVILVYINCCHISNSIRLENLGNLPRARSKSSGIDKKIIESLPHFKFSTLKGLKNGLECSVCLAAFEDVEVLRMLPKCKHAFHIECIDKWLEKNSSCPLCRFKVVMDDIALFMNSNSLRFKLSGPSSLGLYIEREGSSRFGTNIENDEILHKFNHRIMVCDDHDPMMLQTRWSSLSSSELSFLKSEIITCVSSSRFDHHISVEIEGSPGGTQEKEAGPRVSCDRRSVSEITVYPRVLQSEFRVHEERLKKLRLFIAQKTVDRFANKEISSSSA